MIPALKEFRVDPISKLFQPTQTKSSKLLIIRFPSAPMKVATRLPIFPLKLRYEL